MTTPTGRDELRIPAVVVAGRFEGKRVFLRIEDLCYAFLGSKASSCVRAPWVNRYTYGDRTVYGRSRTWGLVRVQIASLKQLRKRLGDSFVQIESGVLVNIDAVVSVDEQRPGAGGLVGVLVSASGESPVVEDLVASRNGRRELLRRLSSRWPASSGGCRRERAKAGAPT
jgi:hypothetical protein